VHELVKNSDTGSSLVLNGEQQHSRSHEVHVGEEHTATARDDTVVVIAKVEPLGSSGKTDWSEIAAEMVR
jgi:hypothetical protein